MRADISMYQFKKKNNKNKLDLYKNNSKTIITVYSTYLKKKKLQDSKTNGFETPLKQRVV